jgi:hypothetical protein
MTMVMGVLVGVAGVAEPCEQLSLGVCPVEYALESIFLAAVKTRAILLWGGERAGQGGKQGLRSGQGGSISYG